MKKLIDRFINIVKNLIRKIFKETVHEKTPTDEVLDDNIKKLKEYVKCIEPLIDHIVKEKIKRFFKYGWKSRIIKIIKYALVLSLIYFAIFRVIEPIIVMVYPKKVEPEAQKQFAPDSSMTIEKFLLSIQYTESRHIAIANRKGSEYWGLYQMGNIARRVGGYDDIPKDAFLNHPEIQHLCMINLLYKNKIQMQPFINEYNGKFIDGVNVTESGILALCQLGNEYAMKIIKSGKIPNIDENGNSPRTLLKLAGYSLDFEKYSFKKLNVKDIK